MEQIIKILKENNLYDANTNEIDIGYNLKEEFIKSYKINKGPKNKFPTHLKREFDGALDINDVPFIISNKLENGNSITRWIILSNGARILLKEIPQHEIENELLFKELCKYLDIPCSNVDVVTFDNTNLLASPSFLALNERLVDYYNLEKKAIMNIEHIIDASSKINQETFVRKTITCDILAENIDRFPNNFRVIESERKKRICPLFDNGLLREGKVRITTPYINGSFDNDDILEFLMQNKKYKEWVLNKIISKPFPNFKDIIEEEKGFYIDDKNYEYFKESLENGKILVLDAFKNS